MKYTSILRVAIFSFAIFANFQYAYFIFNFTHAENLLLYSLDLVADGLVLLILGYSWLSCLYFEIFKSKYYMEIDNLMEKGRNLVNNKVAVLIPVVNEPIEIVKKTLQAALMMEGNKVVFLLDDGHRDELRYLSQSLNVEYVVRADKKFHKAGNLNNGLKYVSEEFVAVFDCDFIPGPNFLKETLPLFADSSIGIVQTPQVYYNEDNFFSKGFKHFQDLFYQYILPAKSLQDSAFCVGTNVVYRKSALDQIKGIPEIDHSEDVNTSLRMYEVGYRTFFLNTELAWGLSSDNAISFFNQQFRWAKGGLTMLFRQSTLFNRKLTLDQRLQFFFSNLFYLSGLSIFIYLVTPILSIIFNSSAINPDYFYEWLTSYVMFFMANFVFYSLITKKNFLQSMALGVLCMVPYTKAMNAAIFNRTFNWITTGAKSSDVVTKLIAPFFTYLFLCIAIGWLFTIKFLNFQTEFLLYMFWIVINSSVVMYLIINCYLSVIPKKERQNDIKVPAVQLLNPI